MIAEKLWQQAWGLGPGTGEDAVCSILWFGQKPQSDSEGDENTEEQLYKLPLGVLCATEKLGEREQSQG